MDGIKNIIIGTIVTVIIGGTAYQVSRSDIIKHFADDTGMTQEQAQSYIDNITEDNLVPWEELGFELIDGGQKLLRFANEIDCMNYYYEWESSGLSCHKEKTQLAKLAENIVLLGQSYVKLSSESASKIDMREAIRLIDQLNSDYQLEIVGATLDRAIIDEARNTNSYNKALLQAVIESE